MDRKWLSVLLLSAFPLAAQYVPVSVSGGFTAADGTVSNTYTFGVAPNLISVEYTPPPPTTITVTPDQFTTFPAGRLAVRAYGDLRTIDPAELTLTYRTTTSTDVAEIKCAFGNKYSDTVNGPVLTCNPYEVGSLDGTHFSTAMGSSVPLLSPTSRETTIDIIGQATRGRIILDTPILSMTYAPGVLTTQTFTYHAVGTAQFAARGFSDYIPIYATGPNTGTIFIAPQQGAFSCTCTTDIQIPGLPSVRLTVLINGGAPARPQVSVSPAVLNFWYQRGDPAPTDQQVTITSDRPTDLFLSPYYDTFWLSITSPPVPSTPAVFNVRANMTTKPAGQHNTYFQVSGVSVFLNIPVNLYVADGPGTLGTAVTPPNAGFVRILPERSSYRNGDFIEASAIALPGYRFVRWSGTKPGTKPAFSFYLNGPTSLTAEFAGPEPCTYQVTPEFLNISASGDADVINVKTEQGCSWSLTGLPAWLSLRSLPVGSGPGTLAYTVPANPSNLPRQATLTLSGKSIPITQPTRRCRNFLPTASASAFDPGGGTIVISRDPSGECSYSPALSNYWAALDRFSSSANIVAEPNPTGRPRITAVYTNGIRFPLIQKSSPNTTAFADAIALLQDKTILDLSANPDAPFTQSDIATAIIRTLYGDFFPYSATPAFADVPASHPAFRYVQKMAELNIAPGCSTGNFCPSVTLTRAQVAEFIVRARTRLPLGQTLPFRAQPFFTDADDRNPAFPFVQKLREWGITNGCAPQRFCPADPITLGQSALLLARAFLAP